MPELPEVENVRRSLEPLIVGKTVDHVRVNYPRMILTGLDAFKSAMPGFIFQNIQRRGKYLIMMGQQQALIAHLRMEGKYQFFADGAVPDNPHFHVIWTFTDGACLVYQDVRKFGTLELVEASAIATYFSVHQLGPEPQDLTLSYMRDRMQTSRRPIKNWLLDQTNIAGLGNIYADEVLWLAQIHPQRLANQLSDSQVKRLRQAIIDEMQLAIAKGGSSVRSYQNALGMAGAMQAFHHVYGKQGQACERCKHTIEKVKLAGRGTHFCPGCQQ